MYFVTEPRPNAPVLFSMDAAPVLTVQSVDIQKSKARVCLLPAGVTVFEGTPAECSDFVYSCAGWVGAANPVPEDRHESAF
jgi:hypothetical protein